MNKEDSNIILFVDNSQFVLTPAIGLTKESGCCRLVIAWFCFVLSFRLFRT